MRSPHGGTATHFGSAIIGLGLMLLSLTLIREATVPLKQSEILPLILETLSSEPIMAVLVSAIITWAFHSSLAAVLLFASLAANGIIPLDLGIYLVLGANLGGAFIAYFASYADGRPIRRLTTANIIMRSVTILLCLPFMQYILEWLHTLHSAPDRLIVNAHTGFNILLALIFLPLTTQVRAVMLKIMPKQKRARSDSDPLYLDENALSKPQMALAGAARETLRLADLIEDMTSAAFEAIKQNDKSLITKAKRDDNKVDAIYKSIKLYLTRLQHESLQSSEAKMYDQILSFATNLEHCGDIIQDSLSGTIVKQIEKGEKFSEDGWQELKDFHKTVIDNMNTAQSIFMSQSTQLADELIAKKRALKQTEFESRRRHFNRLSERQPQSMATSSIHLDLMRDLGRINSYIASVAYSVLNAHVEVQDKGV
jgi:phosphate:Na+ symporter